MTVARPTTATILFTDLVNSTELLQRVGDEAAQRVFETHHRLLRDAVAAHGGAEVKWTGDGLMVAFESATSAVRCAIAMQQAARRPAAGERMRIRVGLQVGEALRHDATDYFGTTVVVASRLCALADAGEILCTALVRALIPDGTAFDFRDRGELALKGIAAPVAACDVLYEHDPLAMLTVTPFVGRGDVIAGLSEKLEQARAGHGSLAMLVGEPGIGKTRTAEEFAAYARHRGATVLRGCCYEGEWAPPFSPFVEAIKEYAAATRADALAATLGSDAGILARIVPALHEMLPGIAKPPPVAAEGERYRLLEAASNLFAKIAASGPVVLLLDDLHWADKGTIAMLRHVARQAPSQALVIVGGYRDVELDRTHPLADALATLRRETNYERIVLRGLAATDIGELLGLVAEHDVPEAFVLAISDETGGNPFFIREVMLHLVDEQKIVQEDGRWVSTVSIAEVRIPEGVREVIGRRLSRVGETCGRMLTVASALTAGFSWDVMAALVDAEDAALLDAVDEALAAQLIVERERGTYDFTHALIRHTLYEELSTPRRVLLHRRIGEALERLYAGDIEPHVAELAHHFYQAVAGGDEEKAIAYATRAGDREMALYDWEEAADHYARALEAMDLRPTVDERRRVELMLLIAKMKLNAGRRQESLECGRGAVALARDLDSAIFSKAVLRFDEAALGIIGAVELVEERLKLLDEALTAVGAADSPQRARLLYSRIPAVLAASSHDRLRIGGYLSALGAADPGLLQQATEAVAIARRLHDPALLAATTLWLRHCIWTPGNARERLKLGEERLAAAVEAADRREEVEARTTLVQDLLALGEIERATIENEAIAGLAREFRLIALQVGSFRVTCLTMAGRFAEAERLLAEVLRESREKEDATRILACETQLYALRSHQGRLAELEDVFRATVEQSPGVPAYRSALAAIYEQSDRLAEARREFEHLAIDEFVSIAQDFTWMIAIDGCCSICVALGDLRRAEVLYELYLPYERQNVAMGTLLSYGSSSRTLGTLATLLRQWDSAQRHFQDALEMSARMGDRVAEVRTQLDYARMLRKRDAEGDGVRARELLQQAFVTAREIGMAKVVADCEALLAEA